MPRPTDPVDRATPVRSRRPRAIVRLLRLRPSDVALTATALLLVFLAHVIIRLVAFPRWCAWIDRLVARRSPHLLPPSPSAAGAAIARVARRTPATRCLVQAIAAMVLFWLCGLHPSLHIGARVSSGKMEAHAWVVSDGIVRVGWLPDLHTFAPFPLGGRSGSGRLPL